MKKKVTTMYDKFAELECRIKVLEEWKLKNDMANTIKVRVLGKQIESREKDMEKLQEELRIWG